MSFDKGRTIVNGLREHAEQGRDPRTVPLAEVSTTAAVTGARPSVTFGDMCDGHLREAAVILRRSTHREYKRQRA